MLILHLNGPLNPGMGISNDVFVFSDLLDGKIEGFQCCQPLGDMASHAHCTGEDFSECFLVLAKG